MSMSQLVGGTSLDVVLDTSRDAIESCMALVGCIGYVSECRKNVVTMMLAIIVGKVTSLYREAFALIFGYYAEHGPIRFQHLQSY